MHGVNDPTDPDAITDGEALIIMHRMLWETRINYSFSMSRMAEAELTMRLLGSREDGAKLMKWLQGMHR